MALLGVPLRHAFPLAIAAIDLHARTPTGSARVGGFAMGGRLYGDTGTRATPRWTYVPTVELTVVGGLMVARPGRYLEDRLGT